MAFIEVEFIRPGVQFHRVGGPSFNTFVVPMQSGQDPRNRNWALPRRKYSLSLHTPVKDLLGNQVDPLTYIEDLDIFFQLVPAGKLNSFRFFDNLDCTASNEPLLDNGDGTFQLQKTYSRFGQSLVRPITKPITSAVLDYKGNPIFDSHPNLQDVVLKNGGGGVVAGTTDHATGVVTSASSPVTASFQYHIPVRLDTDDLGIQVEPSKVADGKPVITWNTFTLIEVKPPLY